MKSNTDFPIYQRPHRQSWRYTDHPTYALLTASGVARCGGVIRDPRRSPAPMTGRPPHLHLVARSS